MPVLIWTEQTAKVAHDVLIPPYCRGSYIDGTWLALTVPAGKSRRLNKFFRPSYTALGVKIAAFSSCTCSMIS